MAPNSATPRTGLLARQSLFASACVAVAACSSAPLAFCCLLPAACCRYPLNAGDSNFRRPLTRCSCCCDKVVLAT
ncbi:hypothetical protein BDU57DRAFT_514843 [Ampelomyces quisqualis]|uniref:Secreted protein n=1 Tax=Ampelomyces quisqualis TaxID=50730 RepID=A0A6A5QS08_AMPQU|nr:hypothetical protein BDU57DRAFT_514843 [Ampelomyces quisqualis]